MEPQEIIELVEYFKEQLGPTANQIVHAAASAVVAGNVVAWIAAGVLFVLAVFLIVLDWNDWDGPIGVGIAFLLISLFIGSIALHDLLAREWVIIQKVASLIPGV